MLSQNKYANINFYKIMKSYKNTFYEFLKKCLIFKKYKIKKIDSL